MYCTQCGKANPEGAKFCAFCGAKMFQAEDVQFPSEKAGEEFGKRLFEREQSAEADRPQSETHIQAQETSGQQKTDVKEPPIQAFEPKPTVRERMYRTVQPIAENPAQPGRENQPIHTPMQPDVNAVERQRPGTEEIPRHWEEPQFETEPFHHEDNKDRKEQEFREEEADEDWWPTEPEAHNEQAEDLWDEPTRPNHASQDTWDDLSLDDEEETEPVKKKRDFSWLKRITPSTVLTSHGTEEMPERKPVIVRRKRDTHVPQRIVKPQEEADASEEGEEDIFFMRPKKAKRAREDDTIDDAYVNSRVRTILLAFAFVALLFASVWLFATNSGQMFLAGFNLSSDAQAYRNLGDTARANNQIKRAADAYYRALSLDPDDYDTALMVGKTQQQIGDYEKAANAYYKCTKLRPTEAEPYEALIKLYEIQNQTEMADYFRDLGRTNTGKADLGN